MFDTIVWATDGSENADRALPYVKQLAGDEGRALVVVHVRELIGGRGGGYPIKADEDELLTKVESQVEELRTEGLTVTFRQATTAGAGPARQVATIAQEVGAELIVVGTRGHGPLAGALLGSVAQHLLHDAHCPVLAIPPHVAEKAGEPVREEAPVGV